MIILSDLIEEFREMEIYETNPEDWMGFLGSDDSYNFDTEFVY